jgi:nicotinamidase-related amidase
MSNSDGLTVGNWRHICVDMQRMFAEDTPWHVPWMKEVSPQITEVTSAHADHTIFTRFITPISSADAVGQWQPYYEKWSVMTREHLPQEMLEVVPELARFRPPARVFDKTTYSPWIGGGLDLMLRRDAVDTLVITGGETDVCVLATALGGIDLGYRVIVLTDAVCSGADETHDASLTLLGDRFSVQLTLVTTEQFLSAL